MNSTIYISVWEFFLVGFVEKKVSVHPKCDPVGRISLMYFNILGGVGCAGPAAALHQHSLYAKALEYSVGMVAGTGTVAPGLLLLLLASCRRWTVTTLECSMFQWNRKLLATFVLSHQTETRKLLMLCKNLWDCFALEMASDQRSSDENSEERVGWAAPICGNLQGVTPPAAESHSDMAVTIHNTNWVWSAAQCC